MTDTVPETARLAAAEVEIERLRAALAAADARADMLDGDLAAALDIIAGAIWTGEPADDEELLAAYEEHFGARLLRTVVTARGSVTAC
jgi:hypothetical protein